jgi:hypothetical protein
MLGLVGDSVEVLAGTMGYLCSPPARSVLNSIEPVYGEGWSM